MTWKQLADHYRNEQEAASFLRADEIYTKDMGGKNNERKLSGEALIAAHTAGERFQVGRGGGLKGRQFMQDLETGNWRKQTYETSSVSLDALNTNWFSLEDFVAAIQLHPRDVRLRGGMLFTT